VWEPRWRALARRVGGWRRRRMQGTDAGDAAFTTVDAATRTSSAWDLPGGEVLAVIAFTLIGLILAAALFGWVLLPLLLLALDALVVVLLVVVAIVGRVVFRRPWRVEAVQAETGERVTADVVGWRAALRRRDEMAEGRGIWRRPDSPAVTALP
jgi:hypothetical protein